MTTNWKCVDCGELSEPQQLDDELRCDSCVDEWKAQENDKEITE